LSLSDHFLRREREGSKGEHGPLSFWPEGSEKYTEDNSEKNIFIKSILLSNLCPWRLSKTLLVLNIHAKNVISSFSNYYSVLFNQ
jgi:hypothetical protein